MIQSSGLTEEFWKRSKTLKMSENYALFSDAERNAFSDYIIEDLTRAVKEEWGRRLLTVGRRIRSVIPIDDIYYTLVASTPVRVKFPRGKNVFLKSCLKKNQRLYINTFCRNHVYIECLEEPTTMYDVSLTWSELQTFFAFMKATNGMDASTPHFCQFDKEYVDSVINEYKRACKGNKRHLLLLEGA